MRRLLLVLALLWGLPAFGQNTTVSGTITDSGGQSWNFGSVQFTFRPSDSNPTAQYFFNGAPFDKNTTIPTGPGALDAAGSFTGIVVPSNTSITPTGSTWTVKVCPAATTACFSKNLTITGATQNISGSVIPPPVHLDLGNPPPGAAAYTDSEVFGAKPGSFYYNITSNSLHMCEVTPFPPCTWLSLSGGGSVASFSAGNLSPLFTTSVANPTTTPALSFSLSNAAANTVFGNNTAAPAAPTFFNLTSFAGLNHNILWVDGVQFSTLASALAACTTNCWIIDTVQETFASNPFVGFAGQARIDFGAGTWTVNAQLIVPATVGLFHGSGRQGTGITVFKAGGSMPINTPLIKFLGTQGQVVGDLIVDCNAVTGSSGMLATDWNENSGADKVLFLNCPVISLNVDGSLFTSIPAQNYFIHNIEAFPQAAGSGTTIGVQLKGNGGGGPEDVSNITVNGAGGHVIRASVLTTNWQQGKLSGIHGEFATNVWEIPATGISAFIGDQITGSTTDTNIVNINAASGANSFIFHNIATNAGPVTMLDGPRSVTLTDQFIPIYEVGGGSVAQQDFYTGSLNIPKHFSTGFSLPYALKNVNYTLLKTDGIINLTTGTTTLTIPHALTGQFWFVRNSQGIGDITTSCDSGQINGLASVNLVAETGAIAYADGVNCFLNTFPQLVASGTAAMTTALIAAGACGATVTVGAGGVLTTDTIDEDFNAAVTAGNNGLLIFHKWPTAGNVNFNYCNPGAGNVTPTAMTVNWSVRRP
jgi:hypothetical protein